MYEEGYKKLVVYQNTAKLRSLVYKRTEKFSRTQPRLVGQMRDAARSVKQNIAEGYKRDSIGSFIQFLKISQASLSELIEDIEDCFEDKIFSEGEFNELYTLAKQTAYLLDRFLISLYKMQKDGTWRKRWQR